ncbi:hypothetical protein L1889_03195 [Paenalcaligenes niemegkensis]|uniref:hypothetical protein n=1 Tax=Paenalcaligenes niemegkensis TaxID=2895469 RepID=UPI001EE7D198|nr:hypothetical protein [Paenalcaligenes niemegkensis]MCQ9615834.1 hypothetical protein [Paenalcaligenes niemegkensis]
MARVARVLFGCLLCFYLGSLQAAPEILQWQTPRAVGWMTGDVITHRIELESPAEQPLLPASLPAVGPLNYWLHLRSVDLNRTKRQSRNHYVLTLEYQSFYVPLDVNIRQIPAFSLSFAEDNTSSPAVLNIPSWSFTMSPLRPVTLTSSASLPVLQEDISPGLPPLQLVATTAGWLFASLLIIGALVLRYYALWPFAHRAARPFAQARDQIHRLKKQASLIHYQQAQRRLHTALNQHNQQRTLLYEDLSTFVVQYPSYAPLLPQLQQFFQASQQLFFGAHPPSEAELYAAWQQLADLSKALSLTERRDRP